MKVIRGALVGHLYTIAGSRSRGAEPASRPWATRWRERESYGRGGPERELTIRGLLSDPGDSDTLVVVLHGCGGSTSSPYAVQAARELVAKGRHVLRVAWRGGDGLGEDLYHAAQTGDVHAVIADRNFAHYRRIWLLGYSLGGHAVLHAASETQDARVVAAAAICPVLHLVDTNVAIDASSRAIYRHWVLDSLKEGYRNMRRADRPTARRRVARAATFRIYDALTVVPRYGFDSVDDYYERACVSKVLPTLGLPTLIVSTRHDPMLPGSIAEKQRTGMSSSIDFRFAEEGGHVALSRAFDLGERAPLGLIPQLDAWLERNSKA
jgi:uncharacterized protein